MIDGWISEAAKWTLDLEVLKYQEERVKIKAGVARRWKAERGAVPDIAVTSYYRVMSDTVWFRRAFL